MWLKYRYIDTYWTLAICEEVKISRMMIRRNLFDHLMQDADRCTFSVDAYRRSRQTLQTSEASVSLLSSLAALSSLTLVTTGSLRSLRTSGQQPN